MDVFNLAFGKKRRRTVKRSVSKTAKPPARLLKICKKYRVKATKKVGSKRVYKSIASLKKMCLKKAMALRKKLMKKCKAGAKRSSPMHRRRARRSMGFGNVASYPVKPSEFYQKMGKGIDVFAHDCKQAKMKPMISCISKTWVPNMMKFGRRRRSMGFGEMTPSWAQTPMFGKRRTGSKTGRKAAMKAFRSFYKRHCAGRRSGFGSGGNPPLYQSMGSEFCPNGMGGVLGATSTGLFVTPCVSSKSSYGRRRYRKSVRGHKASHRRTRRSSAMEFGRRRSHKSKKSSCARKVSRRRTTRRSSAMEFGRRRSRKSKKTSCARKVSRRRTRRSTKSMAFGARRRYCRPRPAKRRINGSYPCRGLKRNVCKSTSGCSYVSTRKRYGCKRKGGRSSAASSYSPPPMPSYFPSGGQTPDDEGYALNAARETIPGFVLFGRRRRRSV